MKSYTIPSCLNCKHYSDGDCFSDDTKFLRKDGEDFVAVEPYFSCNKHQEAHYCDTCKTMIDFGRDYVKLEVHTSNYPYPMRLMTTDEKHFCSNECFMKGVL